MLTIPNCSALLGPQDFVAANRFFAIWLRLRRKRAFATFLDSFGRAGISLLRAVDLDVRTKVARALGWKPIPDLLKEVHEGDVSLKEGWPLHWWDSSLSARTCLIGELAMLQYSNSKRTVTLPMLARAQ